MKYHLKRNSRQLQNSMYLILHMRIFRIQPFVDYTGGEDVR